MGSCLLSRDQPPRCDGQRCKGSRADKYVCLLLPNGESGGGVYGDRYYRSGNERGGERPADDPCRQFGRRSATVPLSPSPTASTVDLKYLPMADSICGNRVSKMPSLRNKVIELPVAE